MKEVTIFTLLKEIENKNYQFYDSLTKEQQQILFKPVVVMMWLVGSYSSINQYMLLDEIVNRYLFTFSKHPKLLYLLMCVCGEHKSKKSVFLKRNVKQQKFKETMEVIELYYNCSPREAETYKVLLNIEDIKEMATSLGYENSQIKLILKEWS
ncbi:MAG: hypothetical protein KDH96_05590 [Candidatus Riesia sp.]|nr:hypothetical protein [Candidatus Riesia sp.]